MTGFIDADGRFWPTTITADVVRLLRGINTDLAAVMADPLGPRKVFVDGSRDGMRKAVEVLYLACEAQVEARGVSPEDFALLLARPATFEAALVALLKSLAAYYPDSPAAKTLSRTLPKWRPARRRS